MFDYEWATVQHSINCRLARTVVVPDAIPPERLRRYGAAGKIRAYPGLKEEYYLADLEPDAGVLDELGLDRGSRSRSCARRRRSRSTTASRHDIVRVDPPSPARAGPGRRAAAHAGAARASSPPPAASSCPSRRSTGPRSSRFADLVVSAGGTMNREAVALGTPVWTTFEGRLGAVDERLIAAGAAAPPGARRGRRARQAPRSAPGRRRACAATRR